jgi:phage RecT family recombinase
VSNETALAVKRTEHFTKLSEMLRANKEQLQAALPSHMSSDRLIRIVLTAYNKTPALLECSVSSIVKAALDAAQLGLEPDGILGHAYLVPYKKAATLIPGYKGYIALAYRSGLVASVSAHVIYKNEKYEIEFGLNERLMHVPMMDGDKGQPVCAYAIATMKDGSHAMVVISYGNIERIRSRSQMPNGKAWRDDWEAMACKTAVRQLAKWMPQSPEMQRAAAKEEALDVGALIISEDGEETIDVTAEEQQPSNPHRDALKDKLAAVREKGSASTAPQQTQGSRTPQAASESSTTPRPCGCTDPDVHEPECPMNQEPGADG